MTHLRKTAVITGGTKGIGKALVYKFIDEGFEIITCSRSTDNLASLEKEVLDKYPGAKIFSYSADLSTKEGCQKFVENALEVDTNIDVLINNTGVFIPGPVLSEPEGNLELMINTNLYSAYYVTRGLAPKMADFGSGHIFNLCSIASIKAYDNGGSYGISKFAMLGFSKSIREELKDKGIRVTAVMPGATLTPSWEGVDLPEERFIPAEDVAKSIFDVYALSDRTVVEELIMRPQLGDL